MPTVTLFSQDSLTVEMLHKVLGATAPVPGAVHNQKLEQNDHGKLMLSLALPNLQSKHYSTQER